ncbi:hypothetical protein GIX10_08260 [Acinetobacter sp. YIM 103518]|uniref:Uncharacterized protein n=1 Tax=Acinetobacter faecalis TaxID=2665161 RepID=A0A6L6GG01_9GAMM|nr:hypothetical protein [Acinetobacter faecalis]MDY6462200.1 hypothetical protein [Acinetobacter faecalis]MDY6486408.1 hypothetical protein [Acinetobacter faecalis]MDY6511060.1 hypothetical protein [Acinetobacter faecalis]MTD11421.1 hypothetical protein [Acinetobacter faecalis]
MASSHNRDIFLASFIPSLFIAGWTWLLHFPWDSVFYTVAAIEFLIFLIILGFERQASDVKGASGWMLFFSIFLQFFILVGITVLRLIVLIAQLFFIGFL